MATRVLIVGDVRLYREGLRLALDRHDRIEVVATANCTEQAVKLTSELEPQVVLLDILMRHSLNLARTILKTSCARCVLLAVREEEEEVTACAWAGVTAFVTRDASLEDLVKCVEAAARGTQEIACSARLAGRLFNKLSELAARQWSAPDLARLTNRELHILRLLERDLSNKEISRLLHIQVATVKNHVHNILSKLGVERRAHAAKMLRGSRRRPGQVDPLEAQLTGV